MKRSRRRRKRPSIRSPLEFSRPERCWRNCSRKKVVGEGNKPMMECTNPGLFSAGPDWLEPGEQRRQEALWQFARGKAQGEGGALTRHAVECRSCARIVESFR